MNTTERYHKIKAMREKGETIENIGRAFGISMQRVSQILHGKIGKEVECQLKSRPPYSQVISGAIAEILQCVEDNPDRLCFSAVFVNDEDCFDELIALTERYPNRKEPFTHFHVAWSITHKNYLMIPGCYWRDWDKESVVEVERFTEQQPALDWLLSPGVTLRQREMLPNGRPVPTRIELPARFRASTDERIQRIELT